MRKTKIIGSFALIGGISSAIAPLAMITGCGCTNKDTKTFPTDKLVIKQGILVDFDHSVNLSEYEKLVIPEGVWRIGPSAFKNVFTTNQYDMGANNKIKEIVFPTGLRIIDESAFEGCTAIETLDFSQLTTDDLTFLKFDEVSENKGNNALSELKAKGTVKYGSKISDVYKKYINDMLVYNGLSKYWVNNEEAPNVSESHIVSINDFHGAAPGFGDEFFATNQLNAGAIRLAQESQEIISKYPGSTFLSCGDYNAGESFSTCKQAETLYPVVKAMNIQYSAVGNHAWEWGKTNLENKHWDSLARTDKTVGNYFVSANILDDSQYRSKSTWCVDESLPEFAQDYSLWNTQRIKWADPYKILDMNGHNVCIIGLTTHDTMTDGNLNAIADLTFMRAEDYNAAVVYAKHLAKEELKDDFNKIESFILLTHCACQPIGDDQKTVDPNGECAKLAANATTDFDAILAAHSHRMCVGKIKNTKTNKDIWIGQAGQSGRYYMDTKLVFNDDLQPGHRLQSISLELKTPKIDGQDLSEPVSKRIPDKTKGYNQMKDLALNSIYPIVRNTAQVYEEQKQISKAELNVPLGVISNDGLPYYYTDHTERSFGTQYMQSDTLVEPATVFAQRGQITEFNNEYKPQIEAGDILPVSVAFNNLDSFKNGFTLAPGQTSREVTKNEVFSQNAFENNIHYGCLTIDQMKQYINYFLEGAGEDRFNYEPKVAYNVPLYLDAAHQFPMTWTDKEQDVVASKTSTEKIRGTSYSCGPVQFYGMSFKVKLVETRTETDPKTGQTTTFKVYQLDDNPELKIWKPGVDDFTKPESWTPAETYVQDTNGYIPIICSSFTWQGGNAQNRMLNHWFTYNENYEKDQHHEDVAAKIAHRMFSLLTRDAIIKYAVRLTLNQQALDYGVNDDLLNRMIVKPQ